MKGLHMLRRISTLLVASAGMIGLCALPASASTTAAHATTHSFTFPTIKGHNVVKAWGWYEKINAARVYVKVCEEQTGSAYAVVAEAVVYNAAGKSKNISAVILQGKKGNEACGHITFTFYSAHLKIHSFVGNGGKILASSAVKKIY
jgi:hypothetical protein